MAARKDHPASAAGRRQDRQVDLERLPYRRRRLHHLWQPKRFLIMHEHANKNAREQLNVNNNASLKDAQRQHGFHILSESIHGLHQWRHQSVEVRAASILCKPC